MNSALTPRQLTFVAFMAGVVTLVVAAAAGWYRGGALGAILAIFAVWAVEVLLVSLSYQGYRWLKRGSCDTGEYTHPATG